MNNRLMGFLFIAAILVSAHADSCQKYTLADGNYFLDPNGTITLCPVADLNSLQSDNNQLRFDLNKSNTDLNSFSLDTNNQRYSINILTQTIQTQNDLIASDQNKIIELTSQNEALKKINSDMNLIYTQGLSNIGGLGDLCGGAKTACETTVSQTTTYQNQDLNRCTTEKINLQTENQTLGQHSYGLLILIVLCCVIIALHILDKRKPQEKKPPFQPPNLLDPTPKVTV